MSEMYGFGEESTEQAPDAAVAPKFYRDYMDKVSKQLQALQDKNDALEKVQNQQAVKDALTAKGYAPQAAGLYAGKPEGLDDWLTANAGALAKLPVAEGEEPAGEELVTPAGVPQSIVTPESQAELARMQAMGTSGVAAPQGSDKELAARIDAMDEPQFDEFMRSQNNRFF